MARDSNNDEVSSTDHAAIRPLIIGQGEYSEIGSNEQAKILYNLMRTKDNMVNMRHKERRSAAPFGQPPDGCLFVPSRATTPARSHDITAGSATRSGLANAAAEFGKFRGHDA